MGAAAVTVLLSCFVTGAEWKPPADWTVVSISNRSSSAEVRLSRQAKDGETLVVPAGCQTEAPASTGSWLVPGTLYNYNDLPLANRFPGPTWIDPGGFTHLDGAEHDGYGDSP